MLIRYTEFQQNQRHHPCLFDYHFTVDGVLYTFASWSTRIDASMKFELEFYFFYFKIRMVCR